jgi:Tol biopolymer transport system component
LNPGTRLGPYEIVAPLGAGGMGEVYRARDTRLGREVAIKVLPEIVSNEPRALARFENEAKAVAALSHPNILALFDVGKESSVSFVVTELLEGETLRAFLARGPVPLRKALDVGLHVAEGLAAAHGKGIVHRDVKPENVFLTKDGHAKILDFGLARSGPVPAGREETQSPTVDKLTSEGVVLGTVAYMSPEQARGQTVDFRSDQFSLGVVLYEMLTGKRPFEGASAAETLAAIIREEPEPLTKLDPKLPAPLVWIVQRCLSKDPEERYSSTKDLAKELQNLRTHLSEAVSAANVAPGEGPHLRRRVPYWALAAAALTAVLGVFAGIRFARSASPLASPLKFSLSFPMDAEPRTHEHNPFALSPDGRTLVFEGGDAAGSADDVRSHLFVRRLDLDEIRPIPGTDGTARFASPFMSPDGLEVGFFADGKLKKVSLSGGSPITLCDAAAPRGGSWGADGTIVFVPSSPSGLWRIPASGGEPRRVTNPDVAKGDRHSFPQILPDGEHVLFDLPDQNRKPRVAVVSLRTGEQRIVMEDAARARYLPTGHLVFARPGTLFAVPFSLKRLETSGSPVPVLEGLVTNSNFTQAAEYAFSQEGTLVYSASRQLQRTLVWVDRKGAAERVPLPPGGYAAVALSPDGGRLAAITVDKDEKQSLVFGDFARGTLSRSAAEGTFQGLAWAPDGKRVAFGLAPDRWGMGVFWQSPDGNTPPERLSETPPPQDCPSFSPDGSLLLVGAVTSGDTGPKSAIFVLPLNGERTLRPFHQTKFGESVGRFSPDGQWVAYRSNESGRPEIFVRPYPGSDGQWQISTEGGDEQIWSRSGRELFYRQGNDKMMVVDVETKPTFRAGRARTLFEGRYHSHGVNFYDVASDGTRFLMIKEDPAESGPAQVKVVLNWFEEVKRRVPGTK